jgi:hypothetical protein
VTARWSPEDLANQIARNPSLRLSRQNSPSSKPIPPTATNHPSEGVSPAGTSKAAKSRTRKLALAMSEDDLQTSVIDLARLYGYKVAHFRSVKVTKKDGSTYWQTPVQGEVGFPDLILLRDGRGLAWELKSQRGQPTPAQTQWLSAFKLAGFDARIIRPSDWLSGEIEHLLR